jgi:hypothetical protein
MIAIIMINDVPNIARPTSKKVVGFISYSSSFSGGKS